MSTSSSIVPSSVPGEEPSSSSISFRYSTMAELELLVRTQAATIKTQEKEIERLNKDLSNTRVSLIKKKGPKDLTGCTAEEALIRDLTKLGKYYQAFYRAFITSEDFGNPNPAFSCTDLIRFASAEYMRQGNIADLYNCIPINYHRVIADGGMDKVVDSFIKGVSSGRSTALSNARAIAPFIFPSIPSVAFKTRSQQNPLSANPEVQRLLGITLTTRTDGTSRWAYVDDDAKIWPPILFLNNDRSDIRGLFKSEQVIMIAKVMLAGRASATGSAGIGPGSLRVGGTYKHIDPHHKNRTTAGLVAWAATAAIYTISDDTEFTNIGIGKNTKRLYLENFETYKRYVMQHVPASVEIYRYWDRQLFPAENPEVLAALGEPTVTPQPTLRLIDPVAAMISNFNSQTSISNADEDEDDEIEEFHPPQPSQHHGDFNPDDMENSADEDVDAQLPEVLTITPNAPLLMPTPAQPLRSLSASEFPPPPPAPITEVPLPQPAPAARKKKPSSRTKGPALGPDPDATIIQAPGRSTRATRASSSRK